MGSNNFDGSRITQSDLHATHVGHSVRTSTYSSDVVNSNTEEEDYQTLLEKYTNSVASFDDALLVHYDFSRLDTITLLSDNRVDTIQSLAGTGMLLGNTDGDSVKPDLLLNDRGKGLHGAHFKSDGFGDRLRTGTGGFTEFNDRTIHPCTLVVVARQTGSDNEPQTIISVGDFTSNGDYSVISFPASLGGTSSLFMTVGNVGTDPSDFAQSNSPSDVSFSDIYIGINVIAASGSRSFYQNGDFSGQYDHAVEARIGPASSMLILGRAARSSLDDQLNGVVYEARVYNKALNDGEALSLMNFLSLKWNGQRAVSKSLRDISNTILNQA